MEEEILNEAPAVEENTLPDTIPVPAKDWKRYIKPALTGTALILALCLAAYGIFKFIQNVDYMRPVREVCSIYNGREKDIKAIYKLSYNGADRAAYKSAYNTLASSDAYFSYYDEISETLANHYRDVAAVGGNNITMKFDATGDKVKMGESELALLDKEFEADENYYQAIIDTIDNMGKSDWKAVAKSMGITERRAKQLGATIRKRCLVYTDYKITAGYYITGRFVLSAKSGDTVDKTDKITIAVIKLNGDWYLYEGRNEGVKLATGSDSLAFDDVLWSAYDKYIKNVRPSNE